MTSLSKSKKKLLFVVTKASWGGAQRYVYDLAVTFRDEYDISVVCGRNEFETEPIFTNKLDEAGITWYQVQSMQRNISVKKEFAAYRELRQLITQINPDIIHLNSPKAAALGGLIAKQLGVSKRIYTLHGMASAEDRPIYQKWLIDAIIRLTIRWCTDVIVPVQSEYDLAWRWREVRDKLYLIHTGIPQRDILSREQTLEKLQGLLPPTAQNKITKGAKIVLGVGEINPNKSWETLIKAVKQLKETGASVIGIHMGTGIDQEKLQTVIQSQGMQNDFFLLGFVPDSYHYMSLADVFVLPSQKELLGYVTLEAAQVPLPVVASRTGGIPEIIMDGETGSLCPVGDVDAFAVAIGRYLDNLQVGRQRAENLQRHYRSDFSFDQMVTKTRAVYQD